MGRRTLLLIASILVAALGTSLIWLYVQGADSRAQQGQALVSAYLLTSPVKGGTAAAEVLNSAQARQVPADFAQGAVTSLAQISGLELISDAVAGQVLLRSMFGATSASGVKDGHAVVTVTVADPDRVAALLKIGDQVAVYAVAPGKSPQLIAPSLTVLTLGSSTKAGPNGTNIPVTIVGFDVDDPNVGRELVALRSGSQPVLELLGKGFTAR